MFIKVKNALIKTCMKRLAYRIGYKVNLTSYNTEHYIPTPTLLVANHPQKDEFSPALESVESFCLLLNLI
jgi:hypothetical protein